MSTREFEVLYEWSKALRDEQLMEDHPEIRIQTPWGRRTRLNHTIRLQGTYRVSRFVLTYQDHYFHSRNPMSRAALAVHKRRSLDITVVDKNVGFDGVARSRTALDKLASWVGARRGLRPHDHTLFKECLVQVEDPAAAAEVLESRAFCEALLDHCALRGVWRVEFQARSGLSTFYELDRVPNFSQAFLNEAAESSISVLASRPEHAEPESGL